MPIGHVRHVGIQRCQTDGFHQIDAILRQPHQDVVAQGLTEEMGDLGRVGAAGRYEERRRVQNGRTIPQDRTCLSR